MSRFRTLQPKVSHNALPLLADDALALVQGGINWRGNPESANVEDRREPLGSVGAFGRWDRSLDAFNEAWDFTPLPPISTPAELNNLERNNEAYDRYMNEGFEQIMRDVIPSDTMMHPPIDYTILDANDARAVGSGAETFNPFRGEPAVMQPFVVPTLSGPADPMAPAVFAMPDAYGPPPPTGAFDGGLAGYGGGGFGGVDLSGGGFDGGGFGGGGFDGGGGFGGASFGGE